MMRGGTAAGIGLALVLAAPGAWAAAVPTVQVNGLGITLVTAPDPPARQETTVLEIAVHDASGNRVAGARVSVDLRMAGMAMEENRPRVRERGAGRYMAAAAFSMGGEWVAAVEVVAPDGRRARGTFPIRVR